ncbi:S-adenosyl-L-methionine-dependent methyltransferase [Plenodomus tracheiphilus IPT5]|uniref:S-adenosyl-L-methionine-dependent methyltransferase n=1 Tax=Plenodomus tracheiphilus IPT5 TaxID=1408161 RepID=A0A6A7AYU8_9PLEO|nr:S-adenosyl-L-methionine-dependent methyltransferase [Plenodomus tracheiphilus IPT5]
MAITNRTPRKNDTNFTSAAIRVSELSASIASYLKAQGVPQPDLSASSSVLPDTPEYRRLRNQLNDAIQDLHLLTNGPLHHFRTLSWSVVDLAAIQIALSFEFQHIVPNDDVGLTATEIANSSGLEADRTIRILKMLATYRIFEEHKGKFRHTANSEFLRTSDFTAMADTALDDCFKSASEMNVMFEASPKSVLSKGNCPFHTRFGKTFYGYYGENQEKGLRFSKAMTGWALVDDAFVVLRDNFDWTSLKNKKVVDVGGGNGGVSAQLAREFKDLKFVVQDLSEHQLSSDHPADVQDRVSFQVADYNEPQPVRDAGIYLMRNVFHNNNDEDSASILRGLIPALEGRPDDARLLINDCIVPQRAGGDITRSEENSFRQLDLMMMMLFGAKERTEDDWKKLFKSVDDRLEIVKMHYNPTGAGLVEDDEASNRFSSGSPHTARNLYESHGPVEIEPFRPVYLVDNAAQNESCRHRQALLSTRPWVERVENSTALFSPLSRPSNIETSPSSGTAWLPDSEASPSPRFPTSVNSGLIRGSTPLALRLILLSEHEVHGELSGTTIAGRRAIQNILQGINDLLARIQCLEDLCHSSHANRTTESFQSSQEQFTSTLARMEDEHSQQMVEFREVIDGEAKRAYEMLNASTSESNTRVMETFERATATLILSGVCPCMSHGAQTEVAEKSSVTTHRRMRSRNRSTKYCCLVMWGRERRNSARLWTL